MAWEWQEVQIDTADQGSVQGFWRRGARAAVLLVHGRIYDAESFRAFGEELLGAGYAVLRINLRGYHASRAGADGGAAYDQDVAASAAWLTGTAGQPVIGLGASLGGQAVFGAAARNPAAFAGVVGWSPVPISHDQIWRLQMPKLLLWSADEPMAGALSLYYDQLPEPKRRQVFAGNAHAQRLWEGAHRTTLVSEVLSFLDDIPMAGSETPAT
jgi:alpha-beta hydrolase superfamily lysophospholipase